MSWYRRDNKRAAAAARGIEGRTRRRERAGKAEQKRGNLGSTTAVAGMLAPCEATLLLLAPPFLRRPLSQATPLRSLTRSRSPLPVPRRPTPWNACVSARVCVLHRSVLVRVRACSSSCLSSSIPALFSRHPRAERFLFYSSSCGARTIAPRLCLSLSLSYPPHTTCSVQPSLTRAPLPHLPLLLSHYLLPSYPSRTSSHPIPSVLALSPSVRGGWVFVFLSRVFDEPSSLVLYRAVATRHSCCYHDHHLSLLRAPYSWYSSFAFGRRRQPLNL